MIGMLGEITNAYKKIGSWTKPSGPTDWSFNWVAFRPKIRKEPVGVVVIITPFNFPLWTMGPLASVFFFLSTPLGLIRTHKVGAIAAGCPALIKPSELTPATSTLMAEIFPKYLDQDVYRLVNGSVDETTKVSVWPSLVSRPWLYNMPLF